MRNLICALTIILTSTMIFNVFASDEETDLVTNMKRNEKAEQRYQKRDDMRAKMEKMREEMKVCKDKVCRCEVKKKHQKSAIDNFKARIQEMEKKYNELDCSKK